MSGQGKPPGECESPSASFYTGSPGHAYHGFKRALHPKAIPFLTQFRAAKFQKYVKPDDAVLEYGIGSGWNLASLKCRRRIGYDVADFLAAQVRALGIEFVSDLSSVSAGSMDVVISHHVLEHLDNPSGALQTMRKILKPGGKLILHVPWEREWRYRHYRAGEKNHHLFTWNAQTIGNLLTVNGFRIASIQVRRYGYDRMASNLAVRFHLGKASCRGIRALAVLLRPLFEVEAICA